MRHQVQQFRIDNWAAVKHWYLDKFAKACGHEIQKDFPIFLVLVDGEAAAFYYASPHVCIWPTVHPDVMSPRAFLETARLVVATTKRTFCNPLWFIDPASVLSDPALLERVGLTKREVAVFSPE
jgi:hypothetical protein